MSCSPVSPSLLWLFSLFLLTLVCGCVSTSVFSVFLPLDYTFVRPFASSWTFKSIFAFKWSKDFISCPLCSGPAPWHRVHVCLFVCCSAGLFNNFRRDYHETWWKDEKNVFNLGVDHNESFAIKRRLIWSFLRQRITTPVVLLKITFRIKLIENHLWPRPFSYAVIESCHSGA